MSSSYSSEEEGKRIPGIEIRAREIPETRRDRQEQITQTRTIEYVDVTKVSKDHNNTGHIQHAGLFTS
jgi:hypothetical protein